MYKKKMENWITNSDWKSILSVYNNLENKISLNSAVSLALSLLGGNVWRHCSLAYEFDKDADKLKKKRKIRMMQFYTASIKKNMLPKAANS